MFLLSFNQALFYPALQKQPFPLPVKTDDKIYPNECKSLFIAISERFSFFIENACDNINHKLNITFHKHSKKDIRSSIIRM